MGGPIPASLGQLWAVERLDLFFCGLAGNNIIGSLPPSLAALSRISEFYIYGNRITGAIPGNLTNLEFLDLSSNELNGSLPSFKGNLSKLDYLNLIGNHLIAIELLDLGSNNFQGPLFPESHPQDQKFLFARNNIFEKYFSSLSQNNKVPNVNFSIVLQNQMCNELENSIKCMNISHLRFNNNTLSGEIPTSLRNCSKLKFLHHNENQLSRNIPTWIGKSINSLYVVPLILLDLALNNLSSVIPAILINITAMIMFTTPEDYMVDIHTSMVSHELTLNGHVNIFANGNMQKYSRSLLMLNLAHNHLSGKIPDKIHKMRALEKLNLSNNLFGSSSPLSLYFPIFQLNYHINASTNFQQNMPFVIILGTLNLPFNNLSGPIPYSGQVNTFDVLS
ncbi:hypothetical protein AMTRI_Chr02g259120 [Amborella trichopoda]